jgi:heme/copper-type cytochrome/quinol oxidase subunit 2
MAQDMDESSRTVRVLVMQVDWDFWSLFWLFWIVLVPVALLVWMAIWVLRRYNRDLNCDLKEREEMYRELEPFPKDEPPEDEP